MSGFRAALRVFEAFNFWGLGCLELGIGHFRGSRFRVFGFRRAGFIGSLDTKVIEFFGFYSFSKGSELKGLGFRE